MSIFLPSARHFPTPENRGTQVPSPIEDNSRTLWSSCTKNDQNTGNFCLKDNFEKICIITVIIIRCVQSTIIMGQIIFEWSATCGGFIWIFYYSNSLFRKKCTLLSERKLWPPENYRVEKLTGDGRIQACDFHVQKPHRYLFDRRWDVVKHPTYCQLHRKHCTLRNTCPVVSTHVDLETKPEICGLADLWMLSLYICCN